MPKKKVQPVVTAVQGVLILVMTVLVAVMMVQITRLQGTARVINYAGIVRGATQREVKLEIVGRPNDDLLVYLDEILDGLKNGGGKHNLVSLKDVEYQKDLDSLMDYWQTLKAEIYRVREKGYEETDIVNISERYFRLADDTVSAAERYAASIATVIRVLELATAVDMAFLVIILVVRSIEAMGMRYQNSQLEKQAFTDQHTGLPNKGRCEEFFVRTDIKSQPLACIVFDLNNLKITNDTLGHSVGDQLIANFARLLRNSVAVPNFVGRYGGDEFMVVIFDASREKVDETLDRLRQNVGQFNRINHGGSNVAEVSYSCGWALSTDFEDCSFRVLFDQADKEMYENKMARKRAQQKK